LNQSETDKAIPLIKDFLTNLKKTNPEDPRIKDIQNILNSLIARKKAYQSSGDSVNVHTWGKIVQGKIDDAKKQGKPAPSISEVWTVLNSKESQQKITASRNVAIARVETDEAREYLKKSAITDLASAQKELKRLSELGRPLTPEEELIKAGIIGFIESKKKEAQVYITSKSILWEKEAQAIFTESNRFITGSYQETYDFRIIERTGILNDPESTAGEKTLARMKPGETISMSQFVEWDMPTSIMNAPELVSIWVSMNEDGTYNIPLFWAERITKEQVKEYKENTILYAELGLSQFIPLIPRITSELQRSWHAISIDGKSSTMEQQILLKELYRLLFGKEITSTNLSEVKHAFSLALWNPTNMKVAMQHTLKIHKLISESSQPIREDVLIEWIRSNNTQDFTNRDFERVL
jgi:hypothetical protein